MSDAQIGYGTTFGRGDGASPEVFTTVAEVVNITPPQLSREEVEASHLSSPDQFNEYKPGMRDGGNPTITMAFLPGDLTHQNILDDYHSNSLVNYQITYPDGAIFDFSGFVTGYAPSEAGNNERLTVEVTFRVSGKPVLTEGP